MSILGSHPARCGLRLGVRSSARSVAAFALCVAAAAMDVHFPRLRAPQLDAEAVPAGEVERHHPALVDPVDFDLHGAVDSQPLATAARLDRLLELLEGDRSFDGQQQGRRCAALVQAHAHRGLLVASGRVHPPAIELLEFLFSPALIGRVDGLVDCRRNLECRAVKVRIGDVLTRSFPLTGARIRRLLADGGWHGSRC